MAQAQLTAVVNAHREGLIARPSLLSVSQAKAHAQRHGYIIDIIAVLDRVDSLTAEIVENWLGTESRARTIYIDRGDLGQARNEAVRAASTEWIAFLDADDLWCEGWLTEVINAGADDQRNIVWHPEANIYFGRDNFLSFHSDMESDGFELSSLVIYNHWSALCAAKRSLLVEVPYPITNLHAGLGYEDWSWNLEVIAGGAIHKIVPGTCHFIRKKTDSLVLRTQLADAIPNLQKRLDWLLHKRADK